jgi:mannose-6-phosphate isomerase-like protein (cupin superfamily)
MSSSIEQVTWNQKTHAIIIRNDYRSDGIKFFTPDDFSQQLAFMKYPTGKLIQPHCHNSVEREVQFTQEVLVIRKGKLRVDFYDAFQKYLESRVLIAGDVILLADGGHGFYVQEDLEMIEIKQGPYAGEMDKVRFESIQADQVLIKNGVGNE